MRIEILRIKGDVYANGEKVLFGVDFNNPPSAEPEFSKLDWLLGWAKIGLMSAGHTIPHFESAPLSAFPPK